jgi:hypothetical protein
VQSEDNDVQAFVAVFQSQYDGRQRLWGQPLGHPFDGSERPAFPSQNQLCRSRRSEPGGLGLRTGSPEDKATFGNQVDFFGMDLAEIDQLSYWVYTTGENRAVDPGNLPSIQFEIDANLNGPPVIDYTTASIIPPPELPGWFETDAVADGEWFLTGDEGDITGCNQVTTCTWDDLQAAVPAARILTVLFNKGRDHAFSGAVDGLQINSDVYDFEPLGVRITAP